MKDSTVLKLLKKYCVAKIQKLEAEEDVLTKEYSSGHNSGEQMAYKDILSLLEEDDEE